MSVRNEEMQVTVFLDHDLVQVSHVAAGLLDLEAQGILATAWRMPSRISPKLSAPAVTRIEVAGPDRRPERHALDTHDARDCWDPFALEWCDVYWKSSFHPESIAKLPEGCRRKVRHYGLAYGVRSRHDRLLGRRQLGSACANYSYQRHKGDFRWRAYCRSVYLRQRRYRSLLQHEEYECNTLDGRVGVYFHPGCYPPGKNDNLDRMNLLRWKIIQCLQRDIGNDFVGGFTCNEAARRHFPREVFPKATSHREYVHLLQSAHIVVSTNGLSECHSWRTAEALAAGAILVTERPANEVDEYFVNGKNVFFYDTPEECAAICRRILESDDETLRDLHRASQLYYRDHVAPSASLLRRLRKNLRVDHADSVLTSYASVASTRL